MPFINTKTNFEIDKSKREELKKGYGKAISIIPGKSERSLMLAFENCPMYFHGEEKEKLAFVEIKLYGKADRGAMNELTGEVCSLLNKVTGIDEGDIYVKYEEVEVWGCGGSNF